MNENLKKPLDNEVPPALLAYMEVQDRRYDPGHWLGGNIDPALRAKRPNRYGYILLGVAFVCAAFAWYYGKYGAAEAVAFFRPLAALNLLAGVKLLRKPKPSGVSQR
jgi:hypothetical protein